MKKLKNKKTIPKVLFYTATPRIFRTTFIGHLYEIAKEYPVILLSEKLDSESAKIIRNKKLFPNIIEIIQVKQHTGEKISLLKRNWYLYNLAKKTIKIYKPDIVVTDNDVYTFELYLLRFAKRAGAINICFQGGFQAADLKKIFFTLNIQTAYLRIPSYIPFKSLKIVLSKIRRWMGYIIYYWILPISVGQLPFFGQTSYILLKGSIGSRDCDYRIVFSRRDYCLHIKDGVASEKLLILAHPWARESRRFLEKAFLRKSITKQKDNRKKITIMWFSDEISIRRKDHSLVAKKEIDNLRREILALISDILKDWKIFIKPHPDTANFKELVKNFSEISSNIEVVNPLEPADKYIEISDIIAGFPPIDTAIFTATLQCRGKPVLLLDMDNDFFGDIILEGVVNINSKAKLKRILESIKNGILPKTANVKLKPEGFSSALEVVKFLYNKKITSQKNARAKNKTLRESKFYKKISRDFAYSPSIIIMRSAESELLSGIPMQEPILDLGCGDGYFSYLIKPTGMEAGCDLSELAIQRAGERKQYRKLVRCDAGKSIPFPANYFKTVFSNSSVEHMDNIDVVLKEVSRVLVPKGRFIFSLGSNYAYEWWPLSEQAKERYLKFQPVYNYFSLEEWKKRLADVGLEIVSYSYYLDQKTIRKVMYLDYYFGRVSLTHDFMLLRPFIKALRLIPQKLLAKYWTFMFGDSLISPDGSGGGILIMAERR